MTEFTQSPYAGKKVLVVGAGVSGQAAVRLLLALQAQVSVADEKMENIPQDFKSFLADNSVTLKDGALSPRHFAGMDFVVTSPGVPYTRLAQLVKESAALSPDNTTPVIMAETDLGLQFVDAPVVAITGTSGKTTTVTLTEAMFKAAGKKVFLGGNVGTPLCDLALSQEKIDVIVLELSSFQLQGCSHLHAHVAIILNLNANHLDQHDSMEEYTTAKFGIFMNQTASDFALLPPYLVDEYTRREGVAPVTELTAQNGFTLDHLQGDHNILNAEAAFFACSKLGVSKATALKVARTFKPLAHRLEHVAKINGIDYINDSKSTTVDSLRAALQSFDSPIILLAGGKFKGGDLQGLLPLIGQKVKAVALYGGSRSVFESAWQGQVPVTWHETMDEAFAWANGVAQTNDVVLLSPATSSYDQYKNYLERGKHFCRLVEGMRQ